MRSADQDECPAVICLHSLFLDPRMFEDLVSASAGNYHFHAPELLGQGTRTDEVSSTVTMDDVTGEVMAYIDRLDIPRYALVGASMGGDVAIRIAARRPESVTRMVLLGSSARAQTKEDLGEFVDLPDRVEREGFTPEIVDMVMSIMFGASTLADRSRDDIHEMWRGRIAELSPKLVHAIRGVFERGGVVDLLAKVQAPTLIISGTEDLGRPPAWSDEVFEAVADAQLLRIKRGHSPTLEAPDVVIPYIFDFLTSATSDDLSAGRRAAV